MGLSGVYAILNCTFLRFSHFTYELTPSQRDSTVTSGLALHLVTEEENAVQQVVLDVMPLTSGFLPLPLVRISKYIPADMIQSGKYQLAH